ncbi:MAG TPA: Gfo/Idh/MocA family oxidoreductase [Pirellulaceae bacterium]|nr:Gfo/Idh/MocA family oxidoreductase [Pirellulaceae bacterium]
MSRRRNRREFLEDSMFAAAAAAAAGSSGRLLAGESDVQSKSPSERLHVAVVGVKGRGGSHIGAFAGRQDTLITHVVDIDSNIGPQRAKEVGKRQGGIEPQWVEDVRKVLEDKSVDIVTIATPNHWHSLMAIWAMQAGKDVYVEKPVSHNVSEGRRAVEAARKYKKICQTGTQSRSNPGMIQAIEFVRSGKIGDVKVARGLCYKRRDSIGPKGTYEIPKNINYDLWSGPAPILPLTRKNLHYDWHWIWAYGNGDLGNQGIHQMDIARWGLGVNTLSKAAFSYGGRLGYEDAGETANTQVVLHDYDKQSLVFEVRGLVTDDYRGAKVGVIFEGTDGYVVLPSYNGGAAFDKDGGKIAEFSGGGDENHFANFLKAVRSRKLADLNADIEEGHLSSALCHTGNISYQLGSLMSADELDKAVASLQTTDNAKDTLERTLAHLKDNKVDMAATKLQVGPVLQCDPQTESFPGNAAANALLTREYRKPFVVPPAGLV